MRILVTGARGQLGSDVVDELIRRGHEPVAADIAEMDITDKAAVDSYISAASPQAVIHCAAYTATDKAEEEPSVCRFVNSCGTRNIAEACRKNDIKMIYISTDYVFDGSGDKPFSVNDAPAPLSVYGSTKYEGETAVRELVQKHFIVRIAWVFGLHGKNFAATMLRLGQSGKVFAVCDQIGSPTYTRDLAPLLCDMAESERYGTYHATNEGFCSWYEYAKKLFELAKMTVEVVPVTSDYFPSKIKRPANSRLDKSALDGAGFSRLPSWESALERYLAELERGNK